MLGTSLVNSSDAFKALVAATSAIIAMAKNKSVNSNAVLEVTLLIPLNYGYKICRKASSQKFCLLNFRSLSF